MEKIEQLEALIQGLVRPADGVLGCAVVARQGQGDMLCEVNLSGVDRAFLNTVISSILLIGEKLGHELSGHDLDYTLIGYGQSAALIVPCSEAVALMAVLNDSGNREAPIEAAREAARKIAALLRNKAAEA